MELEEEAVWPVMSMTITRQPSTEQVRDSLLPLDKIEQSLELALIS